MDQMSFLLSSNDFTRIRTCNLSSESQLITTRPWQLFIYIYIYIYIYSLQQKQTTNIYFNEVVFPSVLGLTSPMAFPQHSPPPSPVPSILPTKSLLSHIFSHSTLLSISSWAYLSLHHYLPAVSQFSLSNTTHLFSQHDQTTSACFVT